MRFSNLLCPTLREDPSEAETISHRLMLRSGMIRQLAAGIYDILPVGLRVIRKVEGIIRSEMNRAGAQEVYLPAVQPAELWKESGRWELLGKEMLRFKDRNDRDFCFGPTHEEIITDLVRREVRSYRDLPKNLFQIQVKFRDEVRPRFGLMRAREFAMKDAYSFDADDEGATASYQKMYEAYTRIFTRCGLKFAVVDADSGNIGGSMSQEFMVLASSGEDELIRCTACAYSANVEKAAGVPVKEAGKPLPTKMERKVTPGKKTVEDVSAFLGVKSSQLIKTLIYRTDADYLAILIPGDREVNEVKLKSYLGATHLGLASAAEILNVTSSPAGFLGPVGLNVGPGGVKRLLTDPLIEKGSAYVVGGNEIDTHVVGAVAGKDFQLGEMVDLHRACAGDRCPKCGGELRSDRGIEVGHIFKLGTKYSTTMGANFTARDGSLQPAVMGCYGIGVGRTAAAAIEQNHDDRGIIFPPALAPFDVSLIVVDSAKANTRPEAEKIYEKMVSEGFDVLYDDREAPAGQKFKDADLLGIPMRITVGEKGLAQGKLEVKLRRESQGTFIEPSKLVEWLKENQNAQKE